MPGDLVRCILYAWGSCQGNLVREILSGGSCLWDFVRGDQSRGYCPGDLTIGNDMHIKTFNRNFPLQAGHNEYNFLDQLVSNFQGRMKK